MGTMATDDHIIAQFQAVNSTMASINSAIRETNLTIGRVEGVQLSQWGAIKRVEKQLEAVTGQTTTNLSELRDITGELDSKVMLLNAKKISKLPPAKKPWSDIFTADNVKLILLVVLAILAAVAGVTIPL
jgi:hypothetical protein